MFKQFFEAFWPKAVNYVADQGLHNILNINDPKHNLETLHKNLKLLSAAAFDVEKEIKNGEDSGRKKRKREVEEWLGVVKSIENEADALGSQVESEGFIMRFLDGGKAAKLNEQVEKLLHQRLNFGEPVLDARGSRGETILTNELVGEAFKENLETILKILEDREVSKIGVYGMGGVGKTTLAKHVYTRLVQEYEGQVVWVTVSHEFTVKSLQDKIARFIGVELSDMDEEAIRAARLNTFFSQKKISVLILDDVWEKLDMKKVGCTFSVENCRLIITTRSLKVCDQIGCEKVHVEKLHQDEAWKLFSETLGYEMQLCSRVEEIAKSMAKLCDGLPLGIITMAGSMRGETTVYAWENALAELRNCFGGKDYMGEEVDEVFKVLKYSFDRLNTTQQNHNDELFNALQLCFMYCSLYPEDEEIYKVCLVREFISEGLVDERRSRRAQIEQGLSILDKLVKVCLLESCVDDDGEECVKMHDLVRGMALKIGKGKYMVKAGNYSIKEITDVEEWTEGLEKVSLMKSGISMIRDGISPNCPNLSTLCLRENTYLRAIPDSFFSKMQGLCTLDLCSILHITMLPDSISNMTRLRSLLLENCCRLQYVPHLGKLKALRELNLSGTGIKDAPQGLNELVNLRFLSMHARGLKKLSRGVLLKLGHLQHLNLPLDIQVEEIKNLQQLEEFRGGVKNVSDFNWFVTE